MQNDQFNDVVQMQVDKCLGMLITKAAEYATEDRLHNFKVAAEIQGVTPTQALAGMMAKHTVSIYDLLKANEVSDFSTEMWDEKITDHINYLLLLQALLVETKKKPTPEIHVTVPVGYTPSYPSMADKPELPNKRLS